VKLAGRVVLSYRGAVRKLFRILEREMGLESVFGSHCS
jgi:hypothetical protein